MLVRVVYVSHMAGSTGHADLERLLASARNRQLDLTGALVVCEGRFAQVLEGRPEAVDEMMAKIGADRRHEALRVLMHASVEKRLFPDWDMGLLVEPNCPEVVAELLSAEPTGERLLGAIQRLMEEVRSAPFR